MFETFSSKKNIKMQKNQKILQNYFESLKPITKLEIKKMLLEIY